MGKCFGCGKKLGIFEGYETYNEEFCEDCYNKRAEIKAKKREEENKKKIEEKKEKIEKLKNPNEKEVLIQIRDALKWIGIALLILAMYFLFR